MKRRSIQVALALVLAPTLMACSSSDAGAPPPDTDSGVPPLSDASTVKAVDASPPPDASTQDGSKAPDGGADAAPDAATGIHLSGTPKVMAFGDSITAATCWRARMWEELVTNGYKNFKMVGSQDSSGDCNDPTYDGHNEGHSGYLVVNLANEEPNGEMDAWFSANPPDVMLFHFGTNDVWNKIPTTTILAAYGVAIDTLRKYAPHVVILLAQIIPMNPPSCPTCAAGVQQLDAAIPAWAAAKSTPASPIIVVDQWTGFDDATDTVDGVHPNATTGSQKVANKWYAALAPML